MVRTRRPRTAGSTSRSAFSGRCSRVNRAFVAHAPSDFLRIRHVQCNYHDTREVDCEHSASPGGVRDGRPGSASQASALLRDHYLGHHGLGSGNSADRSLLGRHDLSLRSGRGGRSESRFRSLEFFSPLALPGGPRSRRCARTNRPDPAHGPAPDAAGGSLVPQYRDRPDGDRHFHGLHPARHHVPRAHFRGHRPWVGHGAGSQALLAHLLP